MSHETLKKFNFSLKYDWLGTTEKVEDVLTVRFLEDFGMDCIELAILCKSERFISHKTVQNILETNSY